MSLVVVEDRGDLRQAGSGTHDLYIEGQSGYLRYPRIADSDSEGKKERLSYRPYWQWPALTSGV